MMDFKETEIKGTATEPYMEVYISVIRGLIHYHERMTLLLNEPEKCGKNECPVLGYENDLYLKSLKIALELMERELDLK